LLNALVDQRCKLVCRTNPLPVDGQGLIGADFCAEERLSNFNLIGAITRD
jgi:hypothetical protein